MFTLEYLVSPVLQSQTMQQSIIFYTRTFIFAASLMNSEGMATPPFGQGTHAPPRAASLLALILTVNNPSSLLYT